MGNNNATILQYRDSLNTTKTRRLVSRYILSQMFFKLYGIPRRVWLSPGLIKRSFSRLSILNFKLLYKSLVRPLLEYCSVIWFPLYKTDEYEIEKVQRRATKLVVGLHDSPYPDRLKTLNLTTLAYRRNRTDTLQVYRIAHKIDNLDFNFFFEPNTNPTRGHRWKIDKPHANARLRLNSFSNRVINPWNKLSEATVTSSSINVFKNALENEWKNDPIKYNFGK